MFKRLGRVAITAMVACVVLCGCPRSSTPVKQTEAPGKPVVYAVNAPLATFCRRIAGDRAEVVFPAPADEDPAYWRPDDQTVRAYQKADLILLNGAQYAKWIEWVALPARTLVDTSLGFREQYIRLDEAVVHTHGPSGEHDHGNVAFTTWLDFSQAVQQAQAIRDALVKIRPADQAAFDEGLASLTSDLLDLDQQMQELADRIGDRPLIVSHPVYQYWTRRYGLNARSVHWEPDEAIDGATWTDLQSLLQSHPADWVIWEGSPLDESVAKLEAAGISSVVFAPGGNRPSDGDFLTTMHDNLQRLSDAFPTTPLSAP